MPGTVPDFQRRITHALCACESSVIQLIRAELGARRERDSYDVASTYSRSLAYIDAPCEGQATGPESPGQPLIGIGGLS